MEKARSLLEAEANLDETDDVFPDSQGGDDIASGIPRADMGQRGSVHASGFAPASVSQSGFSPVGSGRDALGTPREPSGLHARPTAPAQSGSFIVAPGQMSGNRLVDTLQSALGAASRNEAGLGSLQRAIRDASRAFTASRQAQEGLTEELRVMHRGLNELMSEKAAVERYAALLTQERDAALDAAEEARREAKRDREFLLREQDRFIQLLLEEHEAEVQQLRRSLSQRPATTSSVTTGSVSTGSVSTGSVSTGSVTTASATSLASAHPAPVVDDATIERAPATVPGVAPAVGELPAEGRKSTPPGEFLSGAALARQALANAGGSDTIPHRAMPLPADNGGLDTRRSETRVEDDGAERAPTYPPAPAVLDLDALAAEIDGNSERPPPIRRIGVAEPKIHLKPARVPQLFDTLVSPGGEIDPNRKG